MQIEPIRTEIVVEASQARAFRVFTEEQSAWWPLVSHHIGDKPAEAVKFFDAVGREELYPPADHPLVLTVGDSSPDSSVGPTADYRIKPDVILEDSRAFFTDGQVTAGSSNAA